MSLSRIEILNEVAADAGIDLQTFLDEQTTGTVTIVTMYRGHDAEFFVHAIAGELTDEQKDEWRKKHSCDDYYEGREDRMNNMFFCTVELLKNEQPHNLVNADQS